MRPVTLSSRACFTTAPAIAGDTRRMDERLPPSCFAWAEGPRPTEEPLRHIL